MDEYLETNRKMWDELTPIHAESEFYDLDGFKRGRCSLQQIEIEEVGDVTGKSMLHLQCHFGMDTLSWARRGATVTGIDFSGKAIELARSLADELGISARFICCNLYDLRSHLSGEYDIVFTSAGVLAWLPDLREWAGLIAHFLKQGGIFYLREFHPIAYMFNDDEAVTAPEVQYPYFQTEMPLRFDDAGSYADRNAATRNVNYEWPHSLSEIINSLIEAGLRLEFLHEFTFVGYQSHPFLTQGSDGNWRYEKLPGGLPLAFSIRAVKE
jgi:SAM-dependent methyltransferase